MKNHKLVQKLFNITPAMSVPKIDNFTFGKPKTYLATSRKTLPQED